MYAVKHCPVIHKRPFSFLSLFSVMFIQNYAINYIENDEPGSVNQNRFELIADPSLYIINLLYKKFSYISLYYNIVSII